MTIHAQIIIYILFVFSDLLVIVKAWIFIPLLLIVSKSN